MAISTDNVDPEHIASVQRWQIKHVQRSIIVFGLISSGFDLATFAMLLVVLQVDQATFQTVWFVISLLTELAVLLVLRTRGPMFRSRPSRLLLWTTLGISLMALAIPYLGSLAEAFGFVFL